MKLSVDRSSLVEVLTAITPATKGDYPTKLAVSDGKLTATATDLEVTISASTDVTDTDDGTVLVHHTPLRDRVRALPDGPVRLELDGSTLTLRSGSSRFRLGTVTGSVFPVLSVPGGEASVVTADDLFAAIRQVAPAASTDTNRAAFCGVYFDPVTDDSGAKTMKLVATDSYRLAVRELAGVGITDTSALVPANALVALERAAGRDDEIAVRCDDTQIAFSGASTVVVARLIAAPYPAYGALLNVEGTTSWKVPGRDLLDSLKRAEVVLKGTSVPVRIALADTGDVTISAAQGAEDFTEEVSSGAVDGDALTFAVNPTFLRAGIEAVGGDDVTISVADPLKPLLLSGDDDTLTYLVMPQRA